jgi:hypothetical protein
MLVQKFKQKATQGEVLQAAQPGESKIGGRKTGKSKPPAVQAYLDHGKSLMPAALLQQLDRARSRQKELPNVEDGLLVANKLIKQRRTSGEEISQELIEEGRGLSKKRKELLAIEQDPVLVKAMEGLRKSLMRSSSISVQQAKQMASAIEIDHAAANGKGAQALQRDATEYFLMSNGGGAGSIQKFTKTDDRAFADAKKKLVNIGANPSRAIIFHEMAHHMEAADPSIADTALQWIQSRSTATQPQKLSEITGNSAYNDNETALPDNFLSPYVGKVYFDRKTGKPKPATEVLSMGVERMSSPEKMVEFYLKDPEHFLFTLGAMRGKKK